MLMMVSPWYAQAALVISGPDTVEPGTTISLAIELDVALLAEIDTLLVSIESNNGGVAGVSATAGPLLGGGSFLANAPGGLGNMAFLSTLNSLGPGQLVTWTFAVDPSLVPPQSLDFMAVLQTFNLDDELTGELVSGVKSVAVVPLPPAVALLALPLALALRLRPAQRLPHA
ncbi:MAG: hypothetical protein RLW61_10030 [Gammaproteobacteria bacterium]